MTTEVVTCLSIWYLATTAGLAFATWRYDRWISRAHDPDAKDATRRVIPTSFLVAGGVAGVELFRLARIFPIAWAVGTALDFSGALFAIVVIAALMIDSAAAYIAAGWPMIAGDVRRQERAREEAEAIAAQRITGQSDEIALYRQIHRIAERYGKQNTIDALEMLND